MKKWIDTRQRPRSQEVRNVSKESEPGVWSVVLVGNHGILEPGSPNWQSLSLGPRPQHMSGKEASIQRTWKLAKSVTSPHRVLTVMDQAHWGYAWKLLIHETLGRMVWQPENRGNILGIFLPLSYIRFHAPGGIVIFWATDQAGMLSKSVLDSVGMAVQRVHRIPENLVALALPSTLDDRNNEWELRRDVNGTRKEKVPRRAGMNNGHGLIPQCPPSDGVEGVGTVGALVAQVETLWAVGRRLMPSLLNRLDVLGPVLGTSRELQILRDLYRSMPTASLAADFFPFLGSQLDIMTLPAGSYQGEGTSRSQKEVEW